MKKGEGKIAKSITFDKETYEEVEDYSSKYLSGNFSIAVTFMIKKFFEYEKMGLCPSSSIQQQVPIEQEPIVSKKKKNLGALDFDKLMEDE